MAFCGRFPLADPFRETGNFIPAIFDPDTEGALLQLVDDAVRALGIRDSVIHTEIKLTADGPRLIEVNGRLGGRPPFVLETVSPVNLFAVTCQVAAGIPVKFEHPVPTDRRRVLAHAPRPHLGAPGPRRRGPRSAGRHGRGGHRADQPGPGVTARLALRHQRPRARRAGPDGRPRRARRAGGSHPTDHGHDLRGVTGRPIRVCSRGDGDQSGRRGTQAHALLNGWSRRSRSSRTRRTGKKAAASGTGAADEGAEGVTVSPPAPVHGSRMTPTASRLADLELPETLGYRLKNLLLGPPIASERQSTERLGRPTALAVLSSDVISSSAYATEQMLIPLVAAVGVAAYTLVIPVTVAVIFVLLFVTLSYLEVVKVYTKAGGAYVVARENFGLTVAQVAAVSLLIDYTLTVAVSVAAGVAAVTSVVPRWLPETTLIAVVLVLLIAYGNLRGIREAGRTFAIPTYFFIANMGILMIVGTVRAVLGSLHAHAVTGHHGAFHVGSAGNGLLLGAGAFVVLKAFASGGSALTGTEAISNGVSVFRQPESRNARITLVWMALILGSLVAGVSAFAAVTHPVPYVSGTPTVISQIGQVRLRHLGPRHRLLRPAADGHHAHPHPGGQHQLHRVPLPGQLRRRGLLPAPPADQARPPAGLLDRHHRAHGGLGGPAGGHQGPGRQAHPALRHRRLHRLHHGRRRDGQVPPHPPRDRSGDGGWPSTARPRSSPSSCS